MFMLFRIFVYHSASKGLFRKPDWDVAASYYERAGNIKLN